MSITVDDKDIPSLNFPVGVQKKIAAHFKMSLEQWRDEMRNAAREFAEWEAEQAKIPESERYMDKETSRRFLRKMQSGTPPAGSNITVFSPWTEEESKEIEERIQEENRKAIAALKAKKAEKN